MHVGRGGLQSWPIKDEADSGAPDDSEGSDDSGSDVDGSGNGSKISDADG